jgi:DNA-binding HxlR family transcriptional regulator
MIYEHGIDEAIIEELASKKKISFSGLLDISKKVNPKTTTRTLSKHLNVMSQQDIIIRDPFRPGVERYCHLHPDAELQKELGIFEGVKSNREKKVLRKKETEEEKRQSGCYYPKLLLMHKFRKLPKKQNLDTL